jgi:hypothetical protein
MEVLLCASVQESLLTSKLGKLEVREKQSNIKYLEDCCITTHQSEVRHRSINSIGMSLGP